MPRPKATPKAAKNEKALSNTKDQGAKEAANGGTAVENAIISEKEEEQKKKCDSNGIPTGDAPTPTDGTAEKTHWISFLMNPDFIALYHLAWLLVLIFIVLIVRIYPTIFLYPKLDDLTTLFVYVACAGGMGATISSAHSIGSYENKYFYWFIFNPFIGIIYGTFSYLLVAGGLMALGNVSSPQSVLTRQTIFFYCALSFLVGFASESFTEQLNSLAAALFKEPKNLPSSEAQTTLNEQGTQSEQQ